MTTYLIKIILEDLKPKEIEKIFLHNMSFFIVKENDLKFVNEREIPTAIYYPKLITEHQAYLSTKDFPVSKKISKEIFSVPFSPYISKKTQEKIVKIIYRSIF